MDYTIITMTDCLITINDNYPPLIQHGVLENTTDFWLNVPARNVNFQWISHLNLLTFHPGSHWLVPWLVKLGRA